MFIEMDCPCKGKYLDKMLQPGILSALKDEKMHGFSLIQKLADNPMFGGTLPDKAGVYRYLKKMEASGLLQSEWELEDDGSNPRRVYAITEHGKECLQEERRPEGLRPVWITGLRHLNSMYGLCL